MTARSLLAGPGWSAQSRHRVVIVGGGFGGLYTARSLRRAPLDIRLIDRRNFHLFQPLLYQVATGGLSPANIAAPLRAVLKWQRNVSVMLGEVVGFDLAQRAVKLSDGGRVEFDSLIVASGASHNYFGNEHWSALAPGLKTIEDATAIRARILTSFERAERERDPRRVPALLTFVIVGAGATGVELAGALAEISRHTLRHEFRRIDPAATRVLLIEGTDRVLPPFAPELSARAERSLRRLGVTVIKNALVTQITAGAVTIRRGDASETIAAETVLWAAGVRASPLGALLADACGAKLDRAGRVIVEPDCSLPGQPNVFVIGDLAHFASSGDRPLPGVAQVAMQQGAHVARVLVARISGKPAPRAFHYRDPGSMATIGRAAAVAEIHGWRFSGYFAWLVWLFLHVLFLIEFQNRVLVLVQWAWNYFTWSRSARLITGDPPGGPA